MRGWEAQIIRGARARGLDPRAVLAVAAQEGLSGRVGDSGHAFGPFQLNDAGGVLTGRPGNHRAFAESPEGINWALDQIAKVSAGKHGAAAVRAIVSQFERPRDPAGEIFRALQGYGATMPAAGAGGSSPATLAAGGVGASAAPPATDILSLIAPLNAIIGAPQIDTSMLPPPVRVSTPRGGVRSPGDPLLGGPASTNPPPRGQTTGYLEKFARPFGLTVTSTTEGNHVKNSYHYHGRAVDFGGDPARMSKLAWGALQRPGSFREMFYTGPGAPPYFIKNGQVRPISELDRSVYDHHHDHVHLAA